MGAAKPPVRLAVWGSSLLAGLTLTAGLLLVVSDNPAEAASSCSTPRTQSLRGKAVILDQCFDQVIEYQETGATFTIHTYYTELNNLTNIAQCDERGEPNTTDGLDDDNDGQIDETSDGVNNDLDGVDADGDGVPDDADGDGIIDNPFIDEEYPGRCEHGLTDVDDADGNNVFAVATANDIGRAVAFYWDRLLPIADSAFDSTTLHFTLFIGEDPRGGAGDILIDDEIAEGAGNPFAVQNRRATVFHEVMHEVQRAYGNPDATVHMESVAKAIEDRVDSSADSWTTSGFIGQWNSYLGADCNRIPCWARDWSTISYPAAAWWTWFMDQYRVSSELEPALGWVALRDFYEELRDAPSSALAALAETIEDRGGDFRDDIIDFYLALWAFPFNPADARLDFVDAEVKAVAGPMSGHTVIPTGVGPAPSPPFAPAWYLDTKTMESRSSRYWEFNPANQCEFIGFSFDGYGSPYGFSVMTVDGGSLVDRWTSYSTSWARTVRSVDLDRVVGVVTAFDRSGNVDVARGCVEPTVTIKQPTGDAPAYVGEATAPRKFVVRLAVRGADGGAVAGLLATDFGVTLTPSGGGADLSADVVNSSYVMEDYWLLVDPPDDGEGAVSGETYGLMVELGTENDTQADSVLYGDGDYDTVIVLDRSGSMGGDTGKLEAAQNAVSLLVNELSESSQAGLVVFDSDAPPARELRPVSEMVGGRPYRDLLIEEIGDLVADGRTSIGDGMWEAAAEHDRSGDPSHTCNFVLLSDGHENEPRYWNSTPSLPDDARVLNVAAASVIHTIAFGPEANEDLLESISGFPEAGTHDYATSSGVVPVDSVVSWQNNLSRIYDHKAAQIGGRQRILTALADSALGGLNTGLVGFEDLTLGTEYELGDEFTASGVPVQVTPFVLNGGSPTSSVFASVTDQGLAQGSGNELFLGNSNLTFGFVKPVDRLTLQFQGGTGQANLMINGELRSVTDLAVLHGEEVGGVAVQVLALGTGPAPASTLRLSGTINSFAIGGQKFTIDEVGFSGSEGNLHPIPVDDATDLLMVSVAWQTDTEGLHSTDLVDPAGGSVSTGYRRTSPSGTNEVWEVPNPVAGTYMLRVKNLPQEYFVSATAQSDYQLYLFFGGQEADDPSGTPVPIIGALVGSDGPLLGAEVTAVVTDPDGYRATMRLFDDGHHGDTLANDGVYGNTYTATRLGEPEVAVVPDEGSEPAEVGSYRVEVDALWRDIPRQAQGSFTLTAGADKDNDGISDNWETAHGLNPASDADADQDPDQDGLPNRCEFQVGTDPRNSDTDDGGESDGSEVPYTPNTVICRPETLDPFDPSDDRIGPLTSLIALAEATTKDGPFIRLSIGRPLTGDLESVTVLRRVFNTDGTLLQDWQPIAQDYTASVLEDFNITDGYRYQYLARPMSTSSQVWGRSVPTTFVLASHDPYPPTGSITISPTGTGRLVDIHLTVDDFFGADHELASDLTLLPGNVPGEIMIRLSNTPSFDGADWRPFTDLVTDWRAANVKPGGIARVHAEFRDVSGNIGIATGGIVYSPQEVGVGLVDPTSGSWHLRDADGTVTTFYFGVPGDIPIVGDWDCDGIDTPGMYRQADGFVYLRNSNSTGFADVQFHFGIKGDIPIAGDWDGDGCDTVGVFRNGHVYLSDKLGANDGWFVAEFDYWFGIPGDHPFTGDFNRDGQDTIGLYRESSGFAYLTEDHGPPSGVASTDNEFFYGIRGDRVTTGDWTDDGIDTVAIYRASDQKFYISYENRLKTADEEIELGPARGIPVAGRFS